MPLLRWDARSIVDVGSVAAGGSISTWSSTGSNALAMAGNGHGGAAPTLHYEGGVPHVRFSRSAMDSYAWFASATSFTIPALYPSGTLAGVTMVVVARMRAAVDDLQQGAAWERVFECSGSLVEPYTTISFMREATNSRAAFGFRNAWQPETNTWTASPSIDGNWQVYIARITNGAPPSSSMFASGAMQSVERSEPFAAITLPRAIARCYLGQSIGSSAARLAGDVREVSLYLGAWSDDMVALEYERQRLKWSTGVARSAACSSAHMCEVMCT